MMEELVKIAKGLELEHEVIEYDAEEGKKATVMTIAAVNGSNLYIYDLGATAVARVMVKLQQEYSDRLKAMGEPMLTNTMIVIGKAASRGPYYHSFDYDDEGRITIINIDRRAVFRAEDISSVQLFIDILQELNEQVMYVNAALIELFGLLGDGHRVALRSTNDGMYG